MYPDETQYWLKYVSYEHKNKKIFMYIKIDTINTSLEVHLLNN